MVASAPLGSKGERKCAAAERPVRENEAVPFERHDSDAARQRVGGRCFICEMLAGNAEFRHHRVL